MNHVTTLGSSKPRGSLLHVFHYFKNTDLITSQKNGKT